MEPGRDRPKKRKKKFFIPVSFLPERGWSIPKKKLLKKKKKLHFGFIPSQIKPGQTLKDKIYIFRFGIISTQTRLERS